MFVGMLEPALAQAWWQTEFVIGTYYDPPSDGVEELADVERQYKQAWSAGFNFQTGGRINHGYGHLPAAEVEQVAQHYGFRSLQGDSYLRHTPSTVLTESAAGEHLVQLMRGTSPVRWGVNYFDEPTEKEEDLVRVRRVMAAVRRNMPDKLFFVNLLPCYAFKSWAAYEEYARSYCDEQTGLQVVSTDNYYPDVSFRHPGSKQGYFSNLGLLRQLAGDRPLWAYVMSRGRPAQMGVRQRRAYLWLSAFAPVAYGAKGLLYFTYDRYEACEIRRDFDYHNRPGWNQKLFFQVEAEPFAPFLCRLRDNTTGFADLAVYSPEQGGTWSVKYAKADGKETTKRMDWQCHGVGTAGLPLTGDLDGDGHDELAYLLPDGQLTYRPAGRDAAQAVSLAPLPALPASGHVLMADLDGNGRCDLLLQTGTGSTLYRDFDAKRRAFKSRHALGGEDFVQLLLADGRAYGVAAGALFRLEGRKWQRLRTLSMAPSAAKPAHYWMEDGRLYVQDGKGRLWYEEQPDGKLIHELSSYRQDYLQKFALHNPVTGQYDLYGVMVPRYEYNGLLNTCGQPSANYDNVAAANRYVRSVLAPIVMQDEWLGAYHAALPPGEQAAYVSLVGNGTPLLLQVPDAVFVGVFRHDKDTYNLLVVNKTDTDLSAPQLRLWGSRARLLPRMATSETLPAAMQTREADGQLQLTLPVLRGGECLVVEVRTK